MRRIKAVPILIAAILLLALGVRAWGIAYDLPYVYHPDELGLDLISLRMVQTGDLNPHWYQYPSLFFYINAAAYLPYYAAGRLLGVFATPGDMPQPTIVAMGVAHVPMPTMILLGRGVTLLFGLATVALTYGIGRKLTGKVAPALLAALLVAVAPTNVSHSRFITPDTFVTFFAAAAFLASVLVYQQGRRWQYLVAGLLVGLTASTKYNGALIGLPLIAAHFLRPGSGGLRNRNLYLGLLLCGVGFFVATPFALIDAREFLVSLGFDGQHYASGHAGMEGETLRWYLAYMWRTAGLIYVLAFLAIVRGVVVRSKETLLLAVFPVIYFAFISSFPVRNDRTFLPATPFLFLLAAQFVVDVFGAAHGMARRRWRGAGMAAVGVFAVAGLVTPVSTLVTETVSLTMTNSRETARVWIAEHLPSGAKVGVEAYTPFVDPAVFEVQGFNAIIDHDPDWYRDNGYDYLVFGVGMYGRFYRDPERYSAQVARYDAFFDGLTLVRAFGDGGYEVRIYSLGSASKSMWSAPMRSECAITAAMSSP